MGTIKEIINPTVVMGQVLYRQIHYRNLPSEIKEYKVTKIGNKYFYCNDNDDRPIDKKTLKYMDKVYSQSSFELFVDKQTILDNNERGRLYDTLCRTFDFVGGAKFTLQQLRDVADILEIPRSPVVDN